MTDTEIIEKFGLDSLEKYKHLIRSLARNPYPMVGDEADRFISKYILRKIK